MEGVGSGQVERPGSGQLIEITVSFSPLTAPLTVTAIGFPAETRSFHFFLLRSTSATRSLPTESNRSVWPSLVRKANSFVLADTAHPCDESAAVPPPAQATSTRVPL